MSPWPRKQTQYDRAVAAAEDAYHFSPSAYTYRAWNELAKLAARSDRPSLAPASEGEGDLPSPPSPFTLGIKRRF